MVSRQSKYLVVLFLLLGLVFKTEAQELDTVIYSEESFDTYYYTDSEQVVQDNKPLGAGLDKDEWEKKRNGLDYKELKEKKEEPVEKRKKSKRDWNIPKIEYLWIVIIAIIFIFLMVVLFKYLKARNINYNYQFNISNEPDVEELKKADLLSDYDKAYALNDYRMAFRYQYLNILKALVNKNLIFYKKDTTNGEYVRQLRGKDFFEQFRILSLAFDEVWYGEIVLSKKDFDQLKPLFEDITRSINLA